MIVAVPPSFARPELLASADWLAENVSRPGVRSIDCRWRVDGTARQLFARAHIPGAAFLDWTTELVDPAPGRPYRLAGPDQLARALARAGIGDGMTIVLYDDTASFHAARVWWSLQVYGFDSVRILDGGWHAWLASGRPTSTATQAPEPATFTPRADPRRRLATSDVRALIGSRDVVLVDTRNPAEYLGQQATTHRYGHIPGAVNVPAALLTAPGAGTFLDAAALLRLFRDRGVNRERRVVTYDTAGLGAAKAAFVLALLGYREVAVYDPGWPEWSEREDLPVES